MAGEGEILRTTREEKGLTYAEIEDVTKIRVRYLQALENEQYHILPGAAYAKGFIRMYAKYLGLDSDEIIRLYNNSAEVTPTIDNYPPLKPIQSTPVWFKPVVFIVMAVIAVAIVIGIAYFTRMNSPTPNQGYVPTPLPSAPETQEPAKPEQPPAQEPNTPPAEETYEGIVAEARITAACWLVVNVDGETVQSGTLPAGTTKVFEGKDRVEFVSIGNAGGLSLKLNGVEISPLGKAGDVIANYVITKENLAELTETNQ